MDNYLTLLASIANRYGYPCLMQKTKDSDQPVEYLSIKLPADSHNRPRTCLLLLDQRLLSLPEQQQSVENFIHFYTEVPFTVKPEAVGEVARMVNFVNKGLVAPGFVLDEAGKILFFRYAFLTQGSQIAEATFISLLGTLTLWLDSFSDVLEAVACEGKSMVEVLEKQIKELASK